MSCMMVGMLETQQIGGNLSSFVDRLYRHVFELHNAGTEFLQPERVLLRYRLNDSRHCDSIYSKHLHLNIIHRVSNY